MIQSVVLDKTLFTLEEAIQWVKEHGYKPNTSAANFDVTNYWRFRQKLPSPKYRYRTKEISPGIELILAYPKTMRRNMKKNKTKKQSKSSR